MLSSIISVLGLFLGLFNSFVLFRNNRKPKVHTLSAIWTYRKDGSIESFLTEKGNPDNFNCKQIKYYQYQDVRKCYYEVEIDNLNGNWYKILATVDVAKYRK